MYIYQMPAHKCMLLGEWTEGARTVHPQAEFYGITETWWERSRGWSALCVGVSTTMQVLLGGR